MQRKFIDVDDVSNPLLKISNANADYQLTAEDLAGLTKIKSYLCYNSIYLTSVVIPEGVTSIEYYAFFNCYNLKSITISSSLTKIGDSAFYNCDNIYAVHISDLSAWLKVSFGINSSRPTVYSKTKIYLNGTFLEGNITIPSDVTKIGSGLAFYLHITGVIIPDEVTEIGTSAFEYCDNLENVVIGNGVTKIGYKAFTACSKLTNIIIPESVINIGDYGFRCGNSTNKVIITMLSTTPPSIQSNSFLTSTLNKIVVPAGCGEAYKAATNWSTLADYIEEAAA